MSAATAIPAHHGRAHGPRAALAGVLFVAIAFAVAALGSTTTVSAVDGWYADAAKPGFTPPNALFGPAWSVLYPLMAVAAWLVWRRVDAAGRRRALATYVVQLALNAVWTPVFFGLFPVLGPAALWLALAVIVALDVAVVIAVVRFARVSRIAAVLLVPYLAWILFATALNAGLAVLNS